MDRLAHRFRHRFTVGLACSALAGLAAWTAPTAADACGGTFCDNLPQPMPIDQTGENILFVVDGPAVTAHIQIRIDPAADAEKFAWVIPVAAMPTFAVGSDALFNSLLAASVPRYRVSETGECVPSSDDGWSFLTDADAGSGAGGGLTEINEVVGALDVTVLTGGTALEVSEWMIANDFADDDAAQNILAEYVAQGWMFAAVKLASHAGVEDVHPLVMRYENGEPCVPLRLTAIAAQEDMEVRTFFLGDARVVPTNYKHVLVNPLKIDWFSNGDNYKEVVTLAVDQDGADGKAFVTEFAGASSAVSRFGIWAEDWDAAAFIDAEPSQVVVMLNDMGLTGCVFGRCTFVNPLLPGILRDYLPAPEGLDEGEYWSSLDKARRIPDQFAAWDGPAFAAALDELVVAPGFAANELLDTWPYLTRLYTTISPTEMTADPIFHANPDLPPVEADRRAIQDFDCALDGDTVVTLPDGREVYVPDGEPWPDFGDAMPWEEDVEEIGNAGGPLAIVDNTALIDQLLAEYNAAVAPGAMGGSEGGQGDGGADTGAGPMGGGVEFTSGSGGEGDDPGADALTRPGCACQVGRGVGGTFGFGIGLLLAGLLTRRRRPLVPRTR